MYRYINSHSFIKYNINPRGTMTGDCQTRAIATALGMTWDDVRKILREHGGNMYSNAILLLKLIKDKDVFNCSEVPIDFNKYTKEGSYYSVGDFCDTVGAKGTYLVACTPATKTDRASHLVCTINGTIYDTWNSSYCKVISVYKPNGKHVTEGIEITSDIPRRIHRLAVEYEACFAKHINDYDIAQHIHEAIPAMPENDIDMIERRTAFSVDSDYNKTTSFNFVIDVSGRFGGIKLKQKSFNITFTNDDTYEDAKADMDNRVSKLVDKYFESLINNWKSRYEVEVQSELSNIRIRHLPQKLINAYMKIDASLRSKVVNMESFCGYTGAVLNVGTEESPFHVMALCKSVKYLNESIRICLKQGYNYWSSYSTKTINILPHGFTYTLRNYSTTYDGDKSIFKKFLSSYEEYEWSIEHNEGYDLDYFYTSWEVPAILE